MRSLILLLLAVTLLSTAPAMAARVSSVPITHDPIIVYQAYPGSSYYFGHAYQGYLGNDYDTVRAAPGILAIIPGTNWSNFVGAAQAQVPYDIKNVVLRKQTPTILQCADIFPAKTIYQQGSANIRLWWPLLYEVPGTTWTLTILYGTPTAYDDDGSGPNPPGYVHTEIWTWAEDATLDSMIYVLQMFHQLPFGRDEVPLISDEVLFLALIDKIHAIKDAINCYDKVTAGLLLGDFEMEVMDACISSSPSFPRPTGRGTGIANTPENPACCKLLADAEYVGRANGLFVSAK